MAGFGVRSGVTAGLVAVVGAALVLSPSEHQTAQQPAVTIQRPLVVNLSAATLPLPDRALRGTVQPLPESTVGQQAVVVDPPPMEAAAIPEVGNAIITVYNTVEPWVAWGFEVVEYAAVWVPIVGWFAPQIGILYDFFESITQSAVYNFAYWISGDVSFFEGLGNIARDSWNALVQLGVDELSWLLPPLPPWPPVFSATTELAGAEMIDDAARAAAEPTDDAAAGDAEADGTTDEGHGSTEEPTVTDDAVPVEKPVDGELAEDEPTDSGIDGIDGTEGTESPEVTEGAEDLGDGPEISGNDELESASVEPDNEPGAEDTDVSISTPDDAAQTTGGQSADTDTGSDD